jgi:hypothetical protein
MSFCLWSISSIANRFCAKVPKQLDVFFLNFQGLDPPRWKQELVKNCQASNMFIQILNMSSIISVQLYDGYNLAFYSAAILSQRITFKGNYQPNQDRVLLQCTPSWTLGWQMIPYPKPVLILHTPLRLLYLSPNCSKLSSWRLEMSGGDVKLAFPSLWILFHNVQLTIASQNSNQLYIHRVVLFMHTEPSSYHTICR